MNYQFPAINHLDDVRPAIAGRDEFIVAEREWGYVVNYMVAMTDTFPEVKTAGGSAKMREEATRNKAIRRECRGLLFNKDGSIIARRLHKFFNVNERDETQFGAIDFTKPHVILEKLDGSMITPVSTAAGLRWGTKMGITDVSMQAEAWIATRPDIAQWAENMLAAGWTPIFEWCSRQQRIVIDYVIDRLVLVAVRRTVEGTYMPYDEMFNLASGNAIEVVRTYKGSAESMEQLMSETKASEGIEGYIIRFDDGHMLKIKGEWYLRIHKTKDNLTHEKNVVELLITDKMDDAKAFMMKEDRERVETFETEFWEGIAQEVENYDRYFNAVVSSGLDRKEFALRWLPTIQDQDPYAGNIVFGKFDGRDTRKMVMDIIAKNVGTQTKIDSVRSLWGGNARWNYQFNGE
jgi:RNA ligase